MLTGLDTLKYHMLRLMDEAGRSSDAKLEIELAFEDIQGEFDNLGQQLAYVQVQIDNLKKGLRAVGDRQD